MALATLLSLSIAPWAEAGSFTNTGSLHFARIGHTATLLQSGKVLVAAGEADGSHQAIVGAELYDPANGSWALTGSLTNAPAFGCTATLLPNGKVLIAGGYISNAVSSAELYDPMTGSWTPTGSMTTARRSHTATLLPNGKVLVAGGAGSTFPYYLSSVEIYDPASGTWTATNSLNTARFEHTATLLPNGKVLVAAGEGTNDIILSSTEMYDPASGTWTTSTNQMINARTAYTATLLPNGKVLVAGGYGNSSALASAELYNPVTDAWTLTGAMTTNRIAHSANLLPNGLVLVTEGYGGGSPYSSAEVYDPASETWTAINPMNAQRVGATATLLANGQVLFASGGSSALASAELYDPGISPVTGKWTTNNPMHMARRAHTSTLLANGQVLVAGGNDGSNFLASVETYDPIADLWTTTDSMHVARASHTATLLSDGRVLIVGGFVDTGNLSSVELFDPATGLWTATNSLFMAREAHSATLLSNGKVLVAGGNDFSGGAAISTAEVFDPFTGTWTKTGPLTFARGFHTATLLPDGKVLVAGGVNSAVTPFVIASAELYDPATGIWTGAESMKIGRNNHTASLLANGKILVAGGNGLQNQGGAMANTEIYDPSTGHWTTSAPMTIARSSHTATVLPNGKVLLSGSYVTYGTILPSAELYDPATGAFTMTGSLNTARALHTATLLPNGLVLAVGGYNSNAILTVERYNSALGYSNSWQPQIATAASPVNLGASFAVTGSQFRGNSEGSSGNGSQNSAADYPLVQLRSIQSGQMVFLPCTNWSANSFVSTQVTNFPPGWALATVFVNGIPSTSSIVNISVPVPAAVTLTNVHALTNGGFQFAFTNNPGALFGVLTTTDPLLALTNWTALGGVTEISPGQFQFTDTEGAIGPQRFYRVRAP